MLTSDESSKQLISIIINSAAGHRTPDAEPIQDVLKRYFTQQGCDVELHIVEQFYALSQLTQKIIARHQDKKGIIVIAGGDGTLNSVAQILMHGKIPMGIIPLGTFNYVARALRIPLDPLEAAHAVLHGQEHTIHVGCVNQYIYLNNASIGLYPRLIEQREFDNHRFGRFRFVAKISGFAVLMREHQKLKLKLIVDGQVKPIESPLVFFGNNQLQLHDYKLGLAECAAQGKLAVVAITEVSKIQILKLIARLQLGTFEKAPEVTVFCADAIRIESKARQMKVAIDGEVIYMQTPLHFSVARCALTVIVPDHSGTDHHASSPL
ncbi:MAG: NAD(+)/NADH kinase [Candidatus Saccharibacteria bacterium]|nr:NAD(+)/NADH kinase [Moraxellaceae bacterium]